jgi:hypothetical protein
MKIKKYYSYYLVLITLVISACGDSNVEKFDAEKSIYSPKDYAYIQTIKREGSFLRDMLGVGNKSDRNNNKLLNINPYLWNASLNILSSAMPLVSIDSASGVIISDWYSLKGKSNERVKISVLVNSKELRADGLNIKVFKQVLKGNSWLSADINPNIAINLERKIVQKAGMLSNQKD